MNNKEVLSVILLATAVWLVFSAMGTLLNMFWILVNTPRLEAATVLAGFENLRNLAFIQLWIGTFLALAGLIGAGGDKDEVDDRFYWFFILIATVGSLIAALV